MSDLTVFFFMAYMFIMGLVIGIKAGLDYEHRYPRKHEPWKGGK